MSRRAWVVGAIGIGMLLGCASRGERLEEARQALIGLPAKELNRCVGIPGDTHVEGDTEYLTYRFEEQAPEADPFDRLNRADPLDRYPGLKVPGGDIDPRRPRERPPGPSEPGVIGVAYCELVFEVRGGEVRNVEVDSRLASGLRNDLECLRVTRRCGVRAR